MRYSDREKIVNMIELRHKIKQSVVSILFPDAVVYSKRCQQFYGVPMLVI